MRFTDQPLHLQIHVKAFNNFTSWIIISEFPAAADRFLLQIHPSADEIISIWNLAKALAMSITLFCNSLYFSTVNILYHVAHLLINTEAKWPASICDLKIYEFALCNKIKQMSHPSVAQQNSWYLSCQNSSVWYSSSLRLSGETQLIDFIILFFLTFKVPVCVQNNVHTHVFNSV